MIRDRKLALVATFLLCGAIAGATYAAFSSTTSTPDNNFSAASSFGSGFRMATGTYNGNAVNDRAITGLGFQPDVVIITGANQVSVMRTSSMAGDASKPMTGASAVGSGRIKSLTADGFTLGTNAQVNATATAYTWTALKAAPGVLSVGTYTGNGGTKAVSGLGFSPEYVMVAGAATRVVHRQTGMTRSFQFDGNTGSSSQITSLDADGFTLGTAVEANESGFDFFYVAFNEVPGAVDAGTYTGNAAASQDIASVGFVPDFVAVRANDTATARKGMMKPGALAGNASQFWDATVNATTGITALQANGFKVGNNTAVNASGVTNHYLALKNTAAGCALPGSSQTVTASGDSWVDQSSPSSTTGSDSVLKVTSKDDSSNTRAFVQFALPTKPTGCSVSLARLRMNNKSPVSGRTLQAHQVAASWAEGTVNWTNQPAVTADAPATATTPASAAYMQWTVTALVTNLYSGSGYGFRVKDATENAAAGPEQQFDATEAETNMPELVVTFSN